MHYFVEIIGFSTPESPCSVHIFDILIFKMYGDYHVRLMNLLLQRTFAFQKTRVIDRIHDVSELDHSI